MWSGPHPCPPPVPSQPAHQVPSSGTPYALPMAGVLCEAGRKPGSSPTFLQGTAMPSAAEGWESKASSAMQSKFCIGQGRKEHPPHPRPSLVALTLHSWPLWLSRIWNRDGGGEGAESSTQSVPRAGGLSITSPGCLLEMGPGSQPPDPLGQNLHFHDLE